MTVTKDQGRELAAVKQRVRAEYLEMPGLRLTEAQAERLWSLDPETCEDVLSELVEAHFLRRTDNGLYIRN